MRHMNTFLVLAIAVGLVGLAGCGGGGQGFRANTSEPLVIMATSIPSGYVSGDYLDWEIPIQGGCGGPYVVKIIEGEPPLGIGTEEGDRHHLTGYVREDGSFSFTVQITDTSCEPFLTSTKTFDWDVAQGPVRIVGSDPGWYDAADYNVEPKYSGDVPGVPKVVYGTFTAWDLIVAGGVPPYTCQIIDDPEDPRDDLGLPTGVNMVPNSCKILGTPIQVSPGYPFLLTVQATDNAGNTTIRKIQWKIDTPTIIIPDDISLPDGKCGEPYLTTEMQIVDGVPPFRYEFVGDVPTQATDDFNWQSPLAPTFDSLTNFTVTLGGSAANKLGPLTYPDPSDSSMDYFGDPTVAPFYQGAPPEGIFIDEVTSILDGVPRRRGNFRVNLHVYSSLVPNEHGQHAFVQIPFSIEASEPPIAPKPAWHMDPDTAMTLEGSWVGAPDYSTLPQFEVGRAYDPDNDGIDGLQLTAAGGVPADGHNDAPHAGQRLPIPATEPVGSYQWEADWAVGPIPAGLALLPGGLLRVVDGNALEKVVREFVTLTATDYQLPLSEANAETRTLGYSVGPDTLIVTQSSSTMSLTDNSNNYSSSTSTRDAPNDTTIKIKKVVAYQAQPTAFLDLDNADLTHPVPSDAGLGTPGPGNNTAGKLLSGTAGGDTNGMDLLVGVVNPSGWWNDVHGMNPRGARPAAHGDTNRAAHGIAKFQGRNQTTYSYSYSSRYCYYSYWSGYYCYYTYQQSGDFSYPRQATEPGVTCVELPDAQGVPAALTPEDDGVFTDGGRMYPFESQSRFGVFVVREGGKVYVPFAYQKGTYTGFGDGITRSYSTSGRQAYFSTVQMAVSPDGRIAAMKLKQSSTNFYEQASQSGIVLFSLTGERLFGESGPGANDGSTYKIIGTGSASTGSYSMWGSNRVMYAQSMALTNSYLYYLIGCRSTYSSSAYSTYFQNFSGHFLMRANVRTSTQGELLPSADGDPEWTQHAMSPTTAVSYGTDVGTMQTTFQQHGAAQYVPNSYDYGTSYLGQYFYWTGSYGPYPHTDYFAYNGSNLQEHTLAPTPFRVSADGRMVAFMAAREATSYEYQYNGSSYGYYYLPMDNYDYSDYSSDMYDLYAWVDFNGAGAKRASSDRRHHTHGSSSGYAMFHGPEENYGNHYGWYNGPTPGLEVSDDGQHLAYVYKQPWYTGNTRPNYSYMWSEAREDVMVASSSGSNWASGFGEKYVTENVFSPSLSSSWQRWRAGALTFTADNQGLVFFMGAGGSRPTYGGSYAGADRIYGSFYLYNLSDTNRVTHMLDSASGGHSASAGTQYTSAYRFSPTTTTSSSSSYFNRHGCINPTGGFISRNRNFLYVASYGALTSSSQTSCELVGMNIASGTYNDSGASINGHAAGRGFRLSGWPSRRGFMYSHYYYRRHSMGVVNIASSSSSSYYTYTMNWGPGNEQGHGRQVMAKDSGYVFWGANYQYSSVSRSYSSSPVANSTYANSKDYPAIGMFLYGFNADMGGPVANLSNVNSSTSYSAMPESLRYLEVPRDGRKVVLVTTRPSSYSTTNAYPMRFDRENVVHVSNIDFETPNGAMHGGFSASLDSSRIESSLGRAGESMALTADGTTLWYAFKAGGSSDNQMQLTRATYNGGTRDFELVTPLVGDSGALIGRVHVLGGGR